MFRFFIAFVLTLWGAVWFSGYAVPELENIFISFTMIIGSFIAGASAEGGGAIAFPVLTLLYDIDPVVARDFSLIIQSCGMTSAAFFIHKQKYPIEKKLILFSLPGGFLGQLIAWSFLNQKLDPVWVKLTFTSSWLSFAFVLFLLRNHRPQKRNGNQILIFFLAFIAGIFTAIIGNGMDIMMFSIGVLYLGVSEKVMTPTSVIIMALHSLIGVFFMFIFQSGPAAQAIDFWMVSLTIVIVGAPLGAYFISSKTKNFLILFLQASLVIQFIASWVILPLDIPLMAWSLSLVITSFCLFYLLGKPSRKEV